MARKIFPEYKLATIRELVYPELRRKADDAELAAALAVLLKDGAKTLRQLAEYYHMHPVTLRRRLRAADVKPVGLGGPNGQQEMYMLAQVHDALIESGDIAPGNAVNN
jgi:hypothetical protein